MISAIESLLRPRSVVVVGASPSGNGFTAAPIRNLIRHGYTGSIHAVNPRHSDVHGVPCVPEIGQLPEVPDTAVIVLSAQRVPQALRDCAQLGVTSATVIAGGFAELGAEGARLEDEIRAMIRSGAIRMVGPNTAGLMNVVDAYVPRAGQNHAAHLPAGAIGVVTQSGALCNTLLNRIVANGHGLSHAVATGSQWDLDVWDFADHLIDDDRTRAILTIVEGLASPEKCLAVARRAAAAGKPLILLKVGRSDLGAAAVQTHSGALAGSADVQLSVLRDSGVIVVDELDELWEVGQLFASWGPPAPNQHGGPLRLGIGTLSGGDGALAVDAAAKHGLACPEISPATAARLADLFSMAHPANPFDYTGEVLSRPELVSPATSALLQDPAFDVNLIAAPVWSDQLTDLVLTPAVDAAQSADRRVAISLWAAAATTEASVRLVQESGLPHFDGSVRAVRAIALYGTHADFEPASSKDQSAPARGAPGTERHAVPYWESRTLLAEAGVPFAPARLVGTAEAATAAAREVGLPVTLKLSSAQVVHKAAAGAVRVFLNTPDDVATAAAELLQLEAGASDLVVEAYATGAVMALLGGHRDPEFGPVLVVGLGGGYAEAYRDVAYVRCPATITQIHQGLDRTTFGGLLRKDPVARAALVDLAVDASRWFADDESVAGFDVNPVLIDLDHQLTAVDARVERFGAPDAGTSTVGLSIRERGPATRA